jgi:outer membrane autotransporter protein
MFKNPTMVTEDGRSVWARGFVGERVQQADATSLHATTDYAGGVVGADLLARPDLRLGVFAGAGESRLAVDLNSGSTDTNTVFGGGYGRYAFASFGAPSFLDFALHGGASTNATSRTINNNIAPSGTEVATANYHGGYVSPELKYGVDLPMWGNYTITPSARVRYVAGFFGGYTESGSTADLTVASRTTQDIEERGEVKLTQTTTFTRDDQLLTSLYGGVVGLQRVGDTTINTVLLGASLPFITSDQNHVVGELGGLGFEWRTRNGVSFFGAGEYTAMSDKSSNVAAKGGLRVAF